MRRFKRAVTLIEVSIAIIIAALLIVGLMNLLSTGMKGSTKGMAHQANLEQATIIMSQIEYDLLRSTGIESPEVNGSDADGKWKSYFAGSGSLDPVTIIYSANGSDGITRRVDRDGKTIQSNTLGQGHKITVNFTHFMASPASGEYAELGKTYQKKHAMWVELTVATKNDKKVGENESISLKRLITIRK